MQLKTLSLQNFRSYSKQTFNFSPDTTLIVGPNTAGKTNILEAMYLLSTGKSFRVQGDGEMIAFEKDIARVKAEILHEDEKTMLEVMLAKIEQREAPLKKYLVNTIPKRRVDFEGKATVVLFSPTDLEIIAGSPSYRRRFLDEVLEQVDREYRVSMMAYEKALRQRNALLGHVQETGKRNEEQFTYWDNLLINNGQLITQKREQFIAFLNEHKKDVADLEVKYDKSTISKERLLQYKDAEVGSGVTLVGPHRDDLKIFMRVKNSFEVKLFGSRGQQRLAVLQLTLLQLTYMEKALSFRPILLLDDIFSELDEGHIHLVFSMLGKQQTILTTTHREFLHEKALSDTAVIELK